MTDDGPDREVDLIEQELFVGSTPAVADAQRRRDLAASLTAALFGSIDEASMDTEARETSNE